MYWFLDQDSNVLYVGKAKNLKNRLTSYTRLRQHSAKTLQLVTTATEVKYKELSSELEALLVEAELIRSHQPKYNILLKDDKSPLYIVITNEQFPRVLTARKLHVPYRVPAKYTFGPFPSAAQVRYVLKVARPIFTWCNELKKTGKPCFYVHLQLCSGACAGTISPEEYDLIINHLAEFLRGKTHEVIKQMSSEMRIASEQQQYEKAATLRDQIQMIVNVTKEKRWSPADLHLPQLMQKEAEEMMIQLWRMISRHITLPKQYPLNRIEAYDISNTQGTNPTASMVVAVDGVVKPSEYRLFNIRSGETPNDYGMMKEALIRRQKHQEWGTPNLVVLDGGKGQLRAGLSVWSWSVPICALAKEPDRLFFYHPETKTYTFERLNNGDPAALLLRRLRDEAHRFAKKQHARRRTAAVIK